MAEWGPDPNWPDRPKRPPDYRSFEYYQRFPGQPGPSGSQAQQFAPPMPRPQLPGVPGFPAPSMLPVQPKGENPRELRNRHEKERRDKLNQSISELASMVPPVVAASRKIDKTSVLRLTAHFLRSHQYVFGDTIGQTTELNSTSAQAVLRILEGFLLTVTYKGIIVVVSPNVQKYLGYTELELLGQNIFTMTHKDDHKAFRDSLMSKTQTLGPNGELLIPDMHEGKAVVAKALASERRTFRVRFKKHTQRSEPSQYLACQVDGSLRKSDRACRAANRCCPIVRRARARGDNPCSSGNDVVFIGVARPIVDSFKKEKQLEQFRMEYRTRHSIDGQIIQSEQRIGLVTGYMTDEVQGVNAMNLMHRDDVRWVVIALREMYDQHRLFGESCYRLMMKNGQFVYMRTRGALEVDKGTKAVTSFVCTNTVMHPAEGQHLIDQMKKKFTLLINNNEEPPQEQHVTDTNDELPAVEDPKQLQKVILHLVTNLPSPQPEGDRDSPEKSEHIHLAIIPPRKERIVRGILRIYNLMKNISNPRFNHNVRRNFAHLEEIPESSQEEDISFEADVPPPNDQSFLPDISTFTSKSFHGRKNVDVFDELFKNLPTPPSSESYQATVEETPDLHTPASFTDYIASQPNTQSKYRFTKPDEDYKIINLEAPETSINISGTERSPDYPMHDETIKKKVVQAENGTNAPLIDANSPSLESFLSEAMIGTEFSQIDEDLICLENTIDPFSDLLMNPDVQEFLGDVDFEPNKQAEQRDPN